MNDLDAAREAHSRANTAVGQTWARYCTALGTYQAALIRLENATREMIRAELEDNQ